MSYNPRLNFLIQILKAIAKNDTPENIYPRLKAKQHLLDKEFAQVLQSWAREQFATVERKAARKIAKNIGNFSNRIQEFPLGNRANNLEIAIGGYEVLLTLFTPTAFPQDWAMTQNNLGAAYSERILGNKAENLEQAIASYQAALQVRTRKDFPEKWATTQNNLGATYKNQILGDKAENLEKAIASYQAALEVRTRTDLPQEWAQTQNNLGVAYCNRILGDRADNLEKAIASYQAALQVFTRKDFPEKWATTQNNLGNAYSQLGNLELAIAFYQAALQVYTRKAFPQDWAMTQNNLGTVYSQADNLEMAIASYQAALAVYTRKAFPQDWAQTQYNLGTAYSQAENLELAIASYQAALQVYTRKGLPQDWAMTQNNLGIAYSKAGNLEQAYSAYKSAIEGVEFLRRQIVSGDESKRKLAEEWNGLYRQMIDVCLQRGDSSQALTYIERSKTQNLVEVIVKRILQQELQPLDNEIAEELLRLKTSEHPDQSHLNQLQAKREEIKAREVPLSTISFRDIQALIDDNTAILQWYIFDDCFRAFIITRHHPEPQIWSSTREDLDKLENWKADYLNIYEPTNTTWRRELAAKLQQLGEILHINEILAQFIPPNIQALIIVPHRYLHLFPFHALPINSNEEFLIDRFINGVRYAPSCQLLQLAKNQPQPSGELGKMFAIQDPNEDLHYTNIEVETIAHNFQPTAIVLKKSQATKDALFEPPHNDSLQSAQWLHFSCHGYFDLESPLNSALALANSRVSSVPNGDSRRYRRFTKDSDFDLEKCLTLGDIFNLNLSQCRLVTLSACQTGVIDHQNTSDEYIGLPSGFIKAGSAVVISTLWSVEDFSTTLLMIRFYDNLSSVSIVKALQEAQFWLRNATQTELIKWTSEHEKIEQDYKDIILEELELWFNPEEKPFNQPIDWAGFCVIE
ncbi:TPR repeat protein [Cylindrospermum sp. NIES-4074]|nr:TPR repeat protein [Cylindrospermum sp. NIES-4074]